MSGRVYTAEEMAREHELKCWPEFMVALLDGTKTFEIRKDDRRYEVGDILHLHGWDPNTEQFTGQEARFEVTYVTTWMQKDGYVVMGLRRAREESGERTEGWAGIGNAHETVPFFGHPSYIAQIRAKVVPALILHTGEPTDG